jgi:Cellulase (glycosyl hydrolase family 5)
MAAGGLLAALAATAVVALGGGGSAGVNVSSVQLPPDGRWFGFSGQTFTHTGRDRGLRDQGLTPERTASDALAGGANSARIQVAWSELEPKRGQVDQHYANLLTRFSSRIERGGGHVLLLLGVPPTWASAKPGDPRAAPLASAIDDYAAYARRVARIFPKAAGIETWNEPNAPFFWNPQRPDPALYTRFHRAAAAAIRAEHPGMPVLLGGLVGIGPNPLKIVPHDDYLEQMFNAGLQPGDFDGAALHLYPGAEGGRMKPLERPGFQGALDSFRDVLRAHGSNAPVWITETGLSTSGPAAVTGAEQATGITQIVQKLLGDSGIAGVYIHTQYDPLVGPAGGAEQGYGLLRALSALPGAPKPAFCALRKMAKNPPPFVGCLV